MLKIGITAGMIYTQRSKRILPYIEKDLLNFISQKKVLPIILPLTSQKNLQKIIRELDGIVLSGGSDVCPQKYGIESKKILKKWPGDPYRDQYEMKVLSVAHKMRKPIFGVCRGLQVLNVFFGGTLYQDIPEQVKTKIIHSHSELYDRLCHQAQIVPHSLFSQLYPRKKNIWVNSLHHQGIKKLGKGFQIDAVSPSDHLIEAISMRAPQLIMAVQWHPEFSQTLKNKVINPNPMWDYFLNECQMNAK